MKNSAAAILLLFVVHLTLNADNWVRHTIMERGHCNTAVALDANGDSLMDVVASFNGRVSLFLAPDWQAETILYQFPGGRGSCGQAALSAAGVPAEGARAHPARQRQGGDPGAGPLPRTGAGDGAVLCGSRRREGPAEPGEHL